jgi:hypothetical protein
VGRFALYQVFERNRQRPSTRGEFAEQIAVQIIHLRANVDSDLSLVAPDPAVSNDGEDLPRVRIENDVLGKDEILSYGFASKTTGWRAPREYWARLRGKYWRALGRAQELSAL